MILWTSTAKFHRINLVSLLLLISVFSFGLSYCSVASDSTGKRPEIRAVDSVIIELQDDFVNIIYFNGSFFAGINSQRNKIFIYDTSGEIKKVINKLGIGPKEYKKIVKFGILSSDEIAVVDETKILFFDIHSEKITSCPLDVKKILPLPHDLYLFEGGKGSLFFTSSSMEHSPSQETYFDFVHTFTVFKQRNCTFKNLGGYPVTSIYRGQLYPTAFEPYIYVDHFEEKVYQIFPYELNIYIYDMSGKLREVLPVKPDQFGKTVYRKEKSLENMIYLLQKNSRFRKIIVGNKYIILQYLEALPDEYISKSLELYNKEGRFKRGNQASIYNKNGQKQGLDFRIDNMSLIGFDEDDYLWVQKIEDDETVKIYKAEIVF